LIGLVLELLRGDIGEFLQVRVILVEMYWVKVGDIGLGFKDWLEWWRDFFPEKRVPIDPLEEGMRF
jgi:hypothetical protein